MARCATCPARARSGRAAAPRSRPRGSAGVNREDAKDRSQGDRGRDKAGHEREKKKKEKEEKGKKEKREEEDYDDGGDQDEGERKSVSGEESSAGNSDSNGPVTRQARRHRRPRPGGDAPRQARRREGGETRNRRGCGRPRRRGAGHLTIAQEHRGGRHLVSRAPHPLGLCDEVPARRARPGHAPLLPGRHAEGLRGLRRLAARVQRPRRSHAPAGRTPAQGRLCRPW